MKLEKGNRQLTQTFLETNVMDVGNVPRNSFHCYVAQGEYNVEVNCAAIIRYRNRFQYEHFDENPLLFSQMYVGFERFVRQKQRRGFRTLDT